MNRIYISVVTFSLLSNIYLVESGPVDNTEVILVHVLFRHGERTTYRFYPTDPHVNETFDSIEPGGLTNNGKLMMFKLGETLKEKYGSLLGEDYREKKLDVRSTDTSRTKMSALLVLAGMWPPSENQKWHPTLLWQPIPIITKPTNEEDLLSPDSCKAYGKIMVTVQNNSTVEEIYIKPYKELFGYIEQHSGLVINDFLDLIQFYFILKAEDDFGYELPDWTKSIYPEPLYSAASMVYLYTSLDPHARKIQSGYLLQKILNDSLAKIDKKLNTAEKKMFLYSGHESTLGNLLHALKVGKLEVPPYGSAVIFELHKGKEDYFLKLKYLKHPLKPSIKDLILPGCDVLCPIHRFIELQRKNENLPNVSHKEACDVNDID